MAQLKQKECKESYRMGVILAAMNSSHSKWVWCRNMYFIPIKCAAVQATALAFHPAFPPLIPPSFCGMPALEVHSGSWIPTRITAVQGCSKSFPWSVFCWFTPCRVSVHPVKADLLQSAQRTGNANSSTCLSAWPWQLGDQHSTLDHSAGPHACC